MGMQVFPGKIYFPFGVERFVLFDQYTNGYR